MRRVELPVDTAPQRRFAGRQPRPATSLDRRGLAHDNQQPRADRGVDAGAAHSSRSSAACSRAISDSAAASRSRFSATTSSGARRRNRRSPASAQSFSPRPPACRVPWSAAFVRRRDRSGPPAAARRWSHPAPPAPTPSARRRPAPHLRGARQPADRLHPAIDAAQRLGRRIAQQHRRRLRRRHIHFSAHRPHQADQPHHPVQFRARLLPRPAPRPAPARRCRSGCTARRSRNDPTAPR